MGETYFIDAFSNSIKIREELESMYKDVSEEMMKEMIDRSSNILNLQVGIFLALLLILTN